MGLIRRVGPAIEPLTSREVKTHLRLDSTNLEPVPTAPLVDLAGTAGNVDNGSHRYRLTFVTADGETDGGDISDVVTVVDKDVDGRVALTALPLGGSTVTARKLYRTKADAEVFYLVATLDNEDETYEDNVADVDLGVGCPTENTTSDPYILGKIQTAREVAEGYLHRALIRQSWTRVLDGLPCMTSKEEIRLPMPNLIEVEVIRYRDFAGDWQTVDEAVYSVDTSNLPGRIIRNYLKVWPIVLPQAASVEIDFICGYGSLRSDVPQAIRDGMMLLIGELHENRESVITGTIVNEMPALKRLWSRHRYVETY